MADVPTKFTEARPAFLDLAHLSRQTGGDCLLQRELLELFRLRSVELLDRMRATAEDPQLEKAPLRDLAHQLKGSALSLGAFDVAAAAENVESAFASRSASQDMGAGKAALTALSAALALTLTEIETHLRALA
jgi:HPt (histidine-containing phosphotransfer) domain-containing protein